MHLLGAGTRSDRRAQNLAKFPDSDILNTPTGRKALLYLYIILRRKTLHRRKFSDWNEEKFLFSVLDCACRIQTHIPRQHMSTEIPTMEFMCS